MERAHIPQTPAEAWSALRSGNERFVAGRIEHPHQDAQRRSDLAHGQAPFAIVFGCADSRVAAEIIFDRGLGDLFVVRTAGHVIDNAVLGSIEYGVSVLGVSLIVVLGHDQCGAVTSTLSVHAGEPMPGGHIRDIVERISPSVLAARAHGLPEDPEAALRAVIDENIHSACELLRRRADGLAERVAQGQCAVVGVSYRLEEGKANLVHVIGDVGDIQDAELTVRLTGS